MTRAQTSEPSPRQPLRRWPGVTAAALICVVWFALPAVVPGTTGGYLSALGGLLGGLLVVVWWAFFSRAPRGERWGAILLMLAALLATPWLLHVSIATAGMGLMFYFYAFPILGLVLVVWALASRRLAPRARRLSLVAAILLACAAWTLVRTAGVTGGGAPQLAWRWTETPEERLLAGAGDEPMAAVPAAVVAPEAAVAWSGFRGARRDGVVRGVRIATDWTSAPPIELWRRPIGPGWSSFAVAGGLLYTQEQRGQDELVTAYSATTGEPVWRHRDAARFWESQGGAGPRATPTLDRGRLYTFGATGILNALDARDGTLLWSRNAASDTGAEVPYWGFSSSPLVLDDLVVVDAGGLAAYDPATGEPRWLGPPGDVSYSSPQLATIAGVEQILLLNAAGAGGFAPADGATLWQHRKASSIVQPAVTGDGDLLVGADPVGTRRIAITRGAGGWTTEERWRSARLKPYFNDFVAHRGHAYGFDGGILAAIGLEDGRRRWKGGRYGHGQLVLLADQDLLLVVSERGELALVGATPERFTELARHPAIEGKTWNHPVLAGDLLLVRNGREMAAFRLPLAPG